MKFQEPNAKEYVFTFPTSFVMMPSAKLVAYYIKGGEIVSAQLEISLEKDLLNTVTIIIIIIIKS